MSTKYDVYIPVIVTALVVLILGAWNPSGLQMQRGGKPSGYPSYLWLALIALVVGIATVWFMMRRSS